MLLKLLQYYFHSLIDSSRQDYVDMGLGIEARYRRCEKYWRKHLEYSKEFQRKSLEGMTGNIAVLGAGRLLDVEIEYISKNFRRVCLIDADPSVRKVWEKKARKLGNIDFRFCEVTGTIDSWSEAFETLCAATKDLTQILSFLNSLSPREAISLSGFDVVISLNLLSQIPIYWRDRVESRLTKDLGFVGEVEPLVHSSCQKLIRHHLAQLNASRAKKVIIITDKTFCHYEKNHVPWEVDDALWGVEVAVDYYSEESRDSWLWHIAPQGVENSEYGAIHEVVAKACVRD